VKRKTPLWSIKANTKLLEKGMTKKELAETLKVNYQQMCSVMSGGVDNETMKSSICTYLKIGI
jgi:DNA-binding XRE family transcriptional regulator